MFYSKRLYLKNTYGLKLSFSDFSGGVNTEVDENCLPYKFAKISYNFKFKKGSLETGLGFEELKLLSSLTSTTERQIAFVSQPNQVNKVWLFPYYNSDNNCKDHLLMASYDNVVYFTPIINSDPYLRTINPEITFTSTPNALYYNIDGNDVMLLTSATDGLYMFRPQVMNTFNTTAPKFTSMCRHYERVFGIEEGKRNKLVFSANLDPTNWDVSLDDAGYIELIDENGSLEKLISFNDYVYVFKEYGIARLSAYGDQTAFSISSLYVTSGKIYGNSVCLCGNKIMFLSKNGIYAFDGYSTTKLSLNIESLFENVDNENCCSAYFNGKYYLGLKLNFNDGEAIGCENFVEGYINNSLIEIDMKTGDINIMRGVDLKSLCSIEYEKVSKLVAAFNGEHKAKLGQLTNTGKLFGITLEKKWVSPYTNLGYPNCKKKIKEFSLVAHNNCKIQIKTDKEEKQYEVCGSESTTTVQTSVEGEMFQITFKSESDNAHISSAQILLKVTK